MRCSFCQLAPPLIAAHRTVICGFASSSREYHVYGSLVPLDQHAVEVSWGRTVFLPTTCRRPGGGGDFEGNTDGKVGRWAAPAHKLLASGHAALPAGSESFGPLLCQVDGSFHSPAFQAQYIASLTVRHTFCTVLHFLTTQRPVPAPQG